MLDLMLESMSDSMLESMSEWMLEPKSVSETDKTSVLSVKRPEEDKKSFFKSDFMAFLSALEAMVHGLTASDNGTSDSDAS